VIAVLGLTFKPETDDMRDSPSLSILPALADKGAVIRAHDPEGVEEARKILPASIEYCDEIYKTMEGADAVVIMTEWNQYRGLDLDKVKDLMRGNKFIDLRNIYERSLLESRDFEYTCVGR
jgi:UDPglucose 6-dehydrogenase